MSITRNSSSYSGIESIFSGGLIIVLVIFSIISLAISILMIISLFKIFKKNGKPGWYCLIPFLNVWTLFVIAGNKGWLSLIPFVNMIFLLISNYKLAIKMGKSKGFGVLVVLLPLIGYPILAFSKEKNDVQPEVNGVNTMNVNNDVNTEVNDLSNRPIDPIEVNTLPDSQINTENNSVFDEPKPVEEVNIPPAQETVNTNIEPSVNDNIVQNNTFDSNPPNIENKNQNDIIDIH